LSVEIEILGVLGTYRREYDRNINVVFQIDGPIGQIEIDGSEVLDAALCSGGDLPDAISPRTRRIVQDALAGRRSRLTLFSTPVDSGVEIE